MIETHQRNIFSMCRLSIDCSPRGRNVVRLNIYCTACSESIDELDTYHMLPRPQKSQESSNIPGSVAFVFVPHDVHCVTGKSTNVSGAMTIVSTDYGVFTTTGPAIYCKTSRKYCYKLGE